MNHLEVQTIIKGVYLVITPDANNPKILDIAKVVLSNQIGDYINDNDIVIARDEMSVIRMIENIKLLSDNVVERFHMIINELDESIQNRKSILYCAELNKVLLKKKTGIFSTPNINLLLKIEKKFG